MKDGLGFLPGSHCPHFDGEENRRPVYTRLVASGEMPPGIAADDGVGLLYRDTEFVGAVTSRPGAKAWQVDSSGLPVAIEPRLLFSV